MGGDNERNGHKIRGGDEATARKEGRKVEGSKVPYRSGKRVSFPSRGLGETRPRLCLSGTGSALIPVLSTSTHTLPWPRKQQSHNCCLWVRLLIMSSFTYGMNFYHRGRGSHFLLSNNVCSVPVEQGRV